MQFYGLILHLMLTLDGCNFINYKKIFGGQMKFYSKLLLILGVTLALTPVNFAETESTMIDVGGHNLYVEDIQNNNPDNHGHVHDERYCDKDVTIVLEPGYGESHETFDKLIYELEPYARIIAYDRANLGQSDTTKSIRTIENQVKELEIVLDELDVEEFIYVAHSIGSFNARVLKDNLGNRMKAIVLVDGSHEDQSEELVRLLPEEFQELYKDQFKVEGNYDVILHNSAVVRSLQHVYKSVPLTVIYATNHQLTPEIEEMWKKYQLEVADMSDNSKVLVHEGGHYIHVENPILVRDAVLDYIDKLY